MQSGGRRNGIVCFVDIKKWLASVYILDASRDGRMLCVDLKMLISCFDKHERFFFKLQKHMKNSHAYFGLLLSTSRGNFRFEAVPALGDWFTFEIDETSQCWRVSKVMKSEQLCNSYIINGRLEVCFLSYNE